MSRLKCIGSGSLCGPEFDVICPRLYQPYWHDPTPADFCRPVFFALTNSIFLQLFPSGTLDLICWITSALLSDLAPMQFSTCLQITLKSGQILTWLDHRPEHNASGLHCTSSLLMQMEANSLLIYVIIQPGLNQAQISTKIAGLLFSHGGLRPPNNSYGPTAADSAALPVSRHPL